MKYYYTLKDTKILVGYVSEVEEEGLDSRISKRWANQRIQGPSLKNKFLKKKNKFVFLKTTTLPSYDLYDKMKIHNIDLETTPPA